MIYQQVPVETTMHPGSGRGGGGGSGAVGSIDGLYEALGSSRIHWLPTDRLTHLPS